MHYNYSPEVQTMQVTAYLVHSITQPTLLNFDTQPPLLRQIPVNFIKAITYAIIMYKRHRNLQSITVLNRIPVAIHRFIKFTFNQTENLSLPGFFEMSPTQNQKTYTLAFLLLAVSAVQAKRVIIFL